MRGVINRIIECFTSHLVSLFSNHVFFPFLYPSTYLTSSSSSNFCPYMLLMFHFNSGQFLLYVKNKNSTISLISLMSNFSEGRTLSESLPYQQHLWIFSACFLSSLSNIFIFTKYKFLYIYSVLHINLLMYC